MRLSLNGLIPKDKIGLLTRADESSAWVASFEGTSQEIWEPLPKLGLDEYRILGLENGDARVIRFAELHRHSDNSLKDGLTKIPTMVSMTEYAGALTDHGNMYGFLEYYTAMNKAGKKPILGFEGYMADMSGLLTHSHVIFLAENEQGYRNLVKLTSESYHYFHSFPHVTWELMEKYKDGIICLSACLGGLIPKALVKGDRVLAQQVVDRFVSIYGKDHFFIEIQNHHIPDEERILPQLVALAKENGLKYVATTDAHYPTEEDRTAHQALLCLRTETTMDNPNKLSYDGEGYYLHNSEQMEERFQDYPEALDASLEIAERCSVKLDLGKVNLPNYQYPAPFHTAEEYMLHIAKKGFQDRFAGTEHLTDTKYLERFDYEYGIIKQMGFCAYFIIVWDFINFAREHDIPVGPGRGSAAGSMIAYCMGITDMDPIQYSLMFERFLNPERISMPDVDTDIAHVDRPKVFEYMTKKYGEENVCRIITFGTFKAKQALKDIARVLGYPASTGARLSSMLKDPTLTLDKALESIAEFSYSYNNDPNDKAIIDLARRIEGCKRHASVHACGFVIAPGPVTDYLPTAVTLDDDTGERVITSQVVAPEVEQLSLIKMDLLGLKNLSAIDETLKNVQDNIGKDALLRDMKVSHGYEVPIQFQDIPLNDRATYEMLRDGKTGGVFQFESEGITHVLHDMLSDVDQMSDEELGTVAFERMVATNALYRPGPLDYIPEYIAGLRDPAKVHYDCPQEADILSSTYGVMVYQEQLMQIAQNLAGYSLGQADILRKACGKKKAELMEQEHDRFINGNMLAAKEGEHKISGCVASSVPKNVAEEIWQKIRKFGAYAFNRSHSACYAWIGYITAYLSCHYPAEFYSAMLNAFIEDSDACKAYLSQAKGRGVELLLPDVQESECRFTAKDGHILFGLQGISGVKNLAVSIVEERKMNGPYADLQDLYDRLKDRGCKFNKKTLEGLVYSGALRSFSENKAALLSQYALIEQDYKNNADMRAMGQLSLFSEEEQKIKLPECKPFGETYELEKEFEAIGMYLSRHPADLYAEQLRQNPTYTPLQRVVTAEPGTQTYRTMGLISNVKEFYTKTSGAMMAAFTLSDQFSEIACVAFPKHYETIRPILKNGAVLCVHGTILSDNKEEGKTQLSVQLLLNPAVEFATKSFVVDIKNKAEQDAVLAFAAAHPGTSLLVLRVYDRLFKTRAMIDQSPETEAMLKKILKT